jgi:chaperonin cofactor prefoldin
MNKQQALEELEDMVSELEARDPFATSPNTINDAQEEMADRLREVIEALTNDCTETRVNPLPAEDTKPTKARQTYRFKRSEIFDKLDTELGNLSDHIEALETQLNFVRESFGDIEVVVRENLLDTNE